MSSTTTIGQAVPSPEPGTFMAMLTAAQHDDLVARSSVLVRAAGETVFREGEESTSVLVLLSGRVRARSAGDGGISVTLGPGSLLGELSAVCGKPRTATVRAVDAARLLVVPVAEYLSLLETDGGIATAQLRRFIGRYRQTERMRG
ncbi:MAG: Crp/Fnr family transcriptional regulator [Spirillospora sp.]